MNMVYKIPDVQSLVLKLQSNHVLLSASTAVFRIEPSIQGRVTWCSDDIAQPRKCASIHVCSRITPTVKNRVAKVICVMTLILVPTK